MAEALVLPQDDPADALRTLSTCPTSPGASVFLDSRYTTLGCARLSLRVLRVEFPSPYAAAS